MRILLLLTLSLTAMSGCSATGTPAARVLDAALVEQTDAGSRIEFVVELDNPRDEHYPLIEARYTIRVEGAGEFRFTEYPTAALPGEDRQRLLLAGALPATGLAGRRWSVSGAVSYQPGGELRQVLTDSGVPRPVASFRGKGTLRAAGAAANPRTP